MNELELNKTKIIKWTLNIFFSDFNDKFLNIFIFIFFVPSLTPDTQGLFISASLFSVFFTSFLGFISSYPIVSHKELKKEISIVLPIACQLIYFLILIYIVGFTEIKLAANAGISLLLGPAISKILVLILRYGNALKTLKNINFFRLINLSFWITIIMLLPSNENEKLLLAILMAFFDAISSLSFGILYFLKDFKNLIITKSFYKEFFKIFIEKEFLLSFISTQISILLGNLTSLIVASNLTSNIGRIQFYYAYKLSAYIYLPISYLYVALGRKNMNFRKQKKSVVLFSLLIVIFMTLLLEYNFNDSAIYIFGNKLYISISTIFCLLISLYPKAVAAFTFGKYMRNSKFINIFNSYFIALLIAIIFILSYLFFSFNGNDIIIPPYIIGLADFISFYILAILILPIYENKTKF